jgi:ssRNA-specific RNase YbeY (16S rRNA maturation enzyme)
VEIKTQLLDELITTRLLAQEARRQKIVPKSKDVDDALTKLKSNFKTEAEFQTWLAEDGQSLQEVRRAIADELAIRELSTQLTGDISVTPTTSLPITAPTSNNLPFPKPSTRIISCSPSIQAPRKPTKRGSQARSRADQTT